MGGGDSDGRASAVSVDEGGADEGGLCSQERGTGQGEGGGGTEQGGQGGRGGAAAQAHAGRGGGKGMLEGRGH